MWELINPIDIENFKKEVENAPEFPHFCIDNFLKDDFAEQVYNSFPDYSHTRMIGREFTGAKEKSKVQVTDSSFFPEPIKKLNDLLAAPEFMEMLRYVFDMPTLEADPKLIGGGIHQTNSGGRLDVHIDFNLLKDRNLHRRLNLLLYFNKDWKEEYGGYLDLWDKDVKNRIGYFQPKFNRLCGFVTNKISYHGVTPLKCPPEVVRQSFATYYYTQDAPQDWDGTSHSTIFKPRPNEYFRSNFLLPFEKISTKFKYKLKALKNKF